MGHEVEIECYCKECKYCTVTVNGVNLICSNFGEIVDKFDFCSKGKREVLSDPRNTSW